MLTLMTTLIVSVHPVDLHQTEIHRIHPNAITGGLETLDEGTGSTLILADFDKD